jgi:Domain of unknown function (DUF4926)
MRKPHIDDQVRLNQDIPELHLRSGMVGVVRSTWFAPTTAFEVEFDIDGGTRALLLERQVSIDDGEKCAPEALCTHNMDLKFWEP